ncbi:MAG: hypothetical protein IH845_05165 [Nanoarchaeota archaeon]|nr:hypothetical protein [Nanoarchaeota archaeon]
MDTKQTQEQILSELNKNTCSEQYHKIPFSNIVYTDGINDLINKCSCWWLISDTAIIISATPKLQKDFLLLTIEVKDKKGIVTLKEDSNEKPIYEKQYDYTDFPLSKFEFYITDNVILLKSEY